MNDFFLLGEYFFLSLHDAPMLYDRLLSEFPTWLKEAKKKALSN
jgi:hypothetical protein